MRFSVELSLENEKFPKDKNRIILSFLKHIFQNYDEEFYNSLYEVKENKMKGFTFSLFMPNCKFTREEIIIPDKKMRLNFSTNSMEEGIMFYNAIVSNVKEPYEIKNNLFTIKSVNMIKEKSIVGSSVMFKTMSPIVVREHYGDNNKTWYHSLNDEKGKVLFIENLKYQLLQEFGEERRLDIEEVRVDILKNKEVKVKNYDIAVLSNISSLIVYGKPYILDYIYKSGVGSKRSSGFGMVDIV